MNPYTKDLKPGDLVYTYHKGVWRVTDVLRRFKVQNPHTILGYSTSSDPAAGPEMNAIIIYEKVLDGKNNPPKGSVRQNCDAKFCTKLDKQSIIQERDETVLEANKKADILLNLL